MITTYIPLYALLTEQEKQNWLNTETGRELNLKITQNNQQDRTYCHDLAFRISRQGCNREKIKTYLSAKTDHPDCLQLKTQIITKFFPGIDLTDASVVLSQRWYSKLVLTYSQQQFRNAWISAFCADDSEEVRAIQDQVYKQYNQYIGFIFREKQSLNKLMEIAYNLQFTYNTDKQRIDYLNRLLCSEWPMQASVYHIARSNVEHTLRWFLNNPTQKARDYVHEIAHAHAVYRFFGLSSETMILGVGREGLCLNFLDLYNYHYNRKAIAEGLGIFQSLQIPLRSFFDEYVEISKFEKNPLYICLRAFIPFLVMGVILTSMYTLLLPLAGHVFLEYLLFIPTLYLSIAASSVYIDYKNSMYTVALTWWYGSLYHAPQFQSNERILSGFKADVTLSTSVAAYYAHSFEACDRREQKYASLASTLTCEEVQNREKNQKYKFDLYMEWYDIHDRKNLGIDIIPDIVLERLKRDHERLEQKMKDQYKTKLFPDNTHAFFKKPVHSDSFSALKNKLLLIEDLKLKIENNLKIPEDSAHQERQLSAIF